MPWYVLLSIALASFAVVVGALVYMGRKGWRLVKRGMSVSKRLMPLVDGLSRQTMDLSLRAGQLQANAAELAASISRLQTSLARVQVISDAVSEAVEPCRLLRGWLSGNRSWSDWRHWSRGRG